MLAITQARASPNVQVVLETLRPEAGGGCERGVLPVAATVAPGLLVADGDAAGVRRAPRWVRVPGHGSAELQVVPADHLIRRRPGL